MTTAFLLACLTFFCQSDFALGTSLFSRPLFSGLITGLIMGDVQTGVIMGATIELAMIGSISIGAALPPDTVTGGILGTALAIASGGGPETALLLGIPIATFVLIVKNFLLAVVVPVMIHKADDFAEEGNTRGIEAMHIAAGLMLSFVSAAIVGIGYAAGNEAVVTLLVKIPEFIKHGLEVTTGILPALGFALLMRMLLNKTVVPFYFLGFALAAYLGVPVTGVAVFGVILAVILVQIKSSNVKAAVGGGNDDDF